MAHQPSPSLWLAAALAAGVAACSETAAREVVPADRESAWDASLPDAVEIPAPLAPGLPPCLTGQSAPGCAKPPGLLDWDCAPDLPTEPIGEGALAFYSLCAPPQPPACPVGHVAHLTTTTCTPIGTACPSGDFLPESEVRLLAVGYSGVIRWVKPGTVGSGSLGDPAGSIAEVLSLSAPGDVIALSRGTFLEAPVVKESVAVLGACVEETTIEAPSSSDSDAVVTLDANGPTMGNLRVAGPRPGIRVHNQAGKVWLSNIEVDSARHTGVWITSEGSTTIDSLVVRDTIADAASQSGGAVVIEGKSSEVSLAHVVLERNQRAGLSVKGLAASVDATGLLVRDTSPPEGSTVSGYGIHIVGPSTVQLERVWVSGSHDAGVLADDGAKLTASNVWVLETRAAPNGQLGAGVVVDRKASATLRRTLVLDADTVGIAAIGGGSVDVEDVVVRGIRTQPLGGYFGYGLAVQGGAAMTARRFVVDRAAEAGVIVNDQESVLRIDDGVVQHTQGTDAGKFGLGAGVSLGGSLEASRVTFESNRAVGIYADQQGTHLTLTDVTVSDTMPEATAGVVGFGTGLQLRSGATGQLTRCTLESNRGAGINVSGEGTSLHADETLVAGTREDEVTGDFGFGLQVQLGGSATVTAARFEGNRSAAIIAADTGSFVQLEDVEVVDTKSAERDASTGRGVEALGGASITLLRSLLRGNRAQAVMAFDPATVVTLTEASILDTLPAACASLPMDDLRSCPHEGAGTGVTAVGGAVVKVESFEIAQASMCGVQVTRDGHVEAQWGWIHGNPIGLNVRVPDYDLSTVMGPTVRYSDNESDFDGVELPIPEPSVLIPEY